MSELSDEHVHELGDVVPIRASPEAQVFFGGPERPRFLRDLLEARVEAVPAGGEIRWATYYFRDMQLAEALVRAHRRGVSVNLAVEGAPRLGHANDAVIRRLGGPGGIGTGLKVLRNPFFMHLHEKLYCFSHPRPVALVGTFNPSGNIPEDPHVIRGIGDQDRGRNFLVELAGPEVAALDSHVRWLHAGPPTLFRRFCPELNTPVRADGLTAYYFPRRRNPLGELLSDVPAGTRLRLVTSHLRDAGMAHRLVRLVRGGVSVELIAEPSHRRVPRRIEAALLRGGVRFARYTHPDRLPMHDKFILAEEPDRHWLAFGSYNLTRTSRWLNHELLVVSSAYPLVSVFAEHWERLCAEAFS